jgi:hypothetical protein
MRDQDDETMSDELVDAIELLREPAAVRPEWRAELLRRARESSADVSVAAAPRARRVSLSVPSAIAAGIVCALLGASAMFMYRRGPQATAVVAQQTPSASATVAANVANTVMLPVRFSLNAPNAGRVTIVGDFNDWNPTTLPMRRSADGRVWEVEVRLPLGRYNYAFLVDGRLARDPRAPSTADDDFGTPNSVLMVNGS